MKKKSLIGRLYTPIDNSYEVNLTSSYEDKRYLAGTSSSACCVTTITSEPFIVPVIGRHSKEPKNHEFVSVSFQDRTYITLFYEHGLI